jgi:hypothetical protein
VQEAHEVANHRRFPRAVYADEPEYLALADGQIDVEQPAPEAVIFGEVLNVDDVLHGYAPFS